MLHSRPALRLHVPARVLSIAACLLALSPVAEAQNQRQPGSGPAAAKQAPGKTGQGVALAPELFRLDSVGLSMNIPEGAIFQANRGAGKESVQITPPPPSQVWLVDVRTPESSNPAHTAMSVAEDALKQLLASVGVLDRQVDSKGILTERVVSTKGVVLEPVKPLTLPGLARDGQRDAARFYVKLPQGEREPALIRGYTIIRVQPGKFVTFDLATTEPQYAAAREVYEVMLGTVHFADPTELTASRGAAIESGVAMLAGLQTADYERAIATMTDQWYRVFIPSQGGLDADAQEVAYKRVRAWKGQRWQLDPQARGSGAGAGNRQEGYLVRIDSRLLQRPDRSTDDPSKLTVVDTIATYFMSADRQEEGWLIQVIMRDPRQRKPVIAKEMGGRSGRSMNVSVTGAMGDTIWKPLVPDRGYLTLVESVLLPQLLIASRTPGELGFYTYRSDRVDANKISLRRDTLEEVADRAGAWRITTRLNENDSAGEGRTGAGMGPYFTLYNERGELIQTSFADGTIQTPTTLQRLSDLWRNKGLPMD